MTTLSNKSRQILSDIHPSMLNTRSAVKEALDVIDLQSAALAQLAVKTTQYETCFRELGEAEQKLIELESVDEKGLMGSRISDLERELHEKRLQADKRSDQIVTYIKTNDERQATLRAQVEALQDQRTKQAAECKLHAAEYVALEDSFSKARQLLKDAANLCSIDELVGHVAFDEMVTEINGFLIKHPMVPVVLSVEEQDFDKLKCAERTEQVAEYIALLFLDACQAADEKLVAKYEK